MKRTTLIGVLALGLVPVAGLIVWLAIDGQLERFFSSAPPASSGPATSRLSQNVPFSDPSAKQSNPYTRGHLVLQQTALHEKPTNTSPVLANIEAGSVITNSVTNGWIPFTRDGRHGWIDSRNTEPFNTAAQHQALAAMIPVTGSASATESVRGLARALSRLDRTSLRSYLARTVTVAANPGQALRLGHNEIANLAPDARILWLPHDEALTLRRLARRAAGFLRQPLLMLSNTTASNASGIRFTVVQNSGRWLIDGIIVDNTHPLLLD